MTHFFFFYLVAYRRALETLMQGDFNIDHRVDGYNMRTVMMEAAFYGNHAACEALLRRKANPNARAKFGRTALHISAISFSADITQSLIKAKVGTTSKIWIRMLLLVLLLQLPLYTLMYLMQ